MRVLLRLLFVAAFVAMSAILLGFFFHDSTANPPLAIVISLALSILLPMYWFRKKEFSGLETFVQ